MFAPRWQHAALIEQRKTELHVEFIFATQFLVFTWLCDLCPDWSTVAWSASATWRDWTDVASAGTTLFRLLPLAMWRKRERKNGTRTYASWLPTWSKQFEPALRSYQKAPWTSSSPRAVNKPSPGFNEQRKVVLSLDPCSNTSMPI